MNLYSAIFEYYELGYSNAMKAARERWVKDISKMAEISLKDLKDKYPLSIDVIPEEEDPHTGYSLGDGTFKLPVLSVTITIRPIESAIILKAREFIDQSK